MSKKRKFSPAQIAAQKRFAEMAKAGKFRKRKTTNKNPVKCGAKRKPPITLKKNRKPRASGSFVIRAQRPMKSGYKYYYLRGDQFVTDAAYADRFSKMEGEARMRAILPKLPRAIHSITIVAE